MKVQELRTIVSLAQQPKPLVLCERPVPRPGEGQVLIRVHCCGVCHTELDEIEGRTPPSQLPRVLGHQVVGTVVAGGGRAGAGEVRKGQRVGVAWIYSACGICSYCKRGLENLCPEFQATGRDADGGYGEYMVAPAAFVYPLPGDLPDLEAAPLLCGGAIGLRSLKLTGLENGQPLGLTGFGSSGHQVLQLVQHLFPDTEVFVFARSPVERAFALELGAVWAGDTCERPPLLMQAIIDTTPAWKPVLAALTALAPGGRLVINAIRKMDTDKETLLNLDYSRHLWMEKEIKSVANVCRADVRSFLDLAASLNLHPEVTCYPLAAANQALVDLYQGHVRGAKVLVMEAATA